MNTVPKMQNNSDNLSFFAIKKRILLTKIPDLSLILTW